MHTRIPRGTTLPPVVTSLPILLSDLVRGYVEQLSHRLGVDAGQDDRCRRLVSEVRLLCEGRESYHDSEFSLGCYDTTSRPLRPFEEAVFDAGVATVDLYQLVGAEVSLELSDMPTMLSSAISDTSTCAHLSSPTGTA